MGHTEDYNRAKTALNRAHTALEKIADDRKAKLDVIDRRADLAVADKDRLKAVVNREADTAYRAARAEVEKHMEAAKAAIRKGRRADSWDTNLELRVSGATGRIRPLLEAKDTDTDKLVTELTNEALLDDDLATIIALRRELPALARRKGLPMRAIDKTLERLDMLTGDKDVAESVAHGREFAKVERGVANMLSSFEFEVAGKGDIGVYLDGTGEKRFRHGYQQGPDGTVIPPKQATADQEAAADRLDREYQAMFGRGGVNPPPPDA